MSAFPDLPDLASSALVVIDVQVGFITPETAPVVPVIAELTRSWQNAGGATIFASFSNPAGSPYERFSRWTRLRDDVERELAPELVPLAAHAELVVEKTTSSLFLAPGFPEQATRWTDLVFCGLDTDSCVLDSAVGAYHHGIRPWLVVDACASSGGAAYHEAGLLLARRNLDRSLLVDSATIRSWLPTPIGDPQ